MHSHPHSIFCATDFSANAKEAESVAVIFASRMKSKLVVGHAAEPITAVQYFGSAAARLEDEVEGLRRAGVVAQPMLNSGFRTADALLTMIQAQAPQMVVISANQRTPLETWAFASTSEEIAQRTATPTLIVQRSEVFHEWHFGTRPLIVVAALDLTASSDAVLRWFKDLVKLGPCKLIVCHANRRTGYPMASDLKASEAQLINPPALQAQIERDLSKKIRDCLGTEDTAMAIGPTWTTPNAFIIETASRYNADLIIVGTHQRQGVRRLLHSSVSRGLLHHADTNVVCVPLTLDFDPRAAHIPVVKRVLVSTNLSPCGNMAIPFAFAVCPPGGLVKIIHVLPPAPKSDTENSVASLKQTLTALEPTEAVGRFLKTEFEIITHRDAAVAICEEAERFGADLVCMSYHDGCPANAVQNPVASEVMKLIQRPLIVVQSPRS